MMELGAFIETVIEKGIEAASNDYKNDKAKREGAVAGFEACRGKTPLELKALLGEAHVQTRSRYKGISTDEDEMAAYWWARCYELEVEWVCNVVSAALLSNGYQVIIPPTSRGVLEAAEILGVAAA